MLLKGEDAVAAISEWVKEEVKRVSSSRHELGKFYFGVSTATMGVIVTLKKLEAPVTLNRPLWVALSFLSVSALIAILMTKPKTWRLREDTDLFDEHNKHVRQISQFIWTWFIVWAVGTAAGIYSVLHKVAAANSGRP